MKNLRMQEKLKAGECIDVNTIGRVDSPGVFVLSRYVGGVDYCNAANEEWIWSIGKDILTGEIVAATDSRFYQHPQYACLWLR
jgi:hypothetical protein